MMKFTECTINSKGIKANLEGQVLMLLLLKQMEAEENEKKCRKCA